LGFDLRQLTSNSPTVPCQACPPSLPIGR
jgi:hypothetical protein